MQSSPNAHSPVSSSSNGSNGHHQPSSTHGIVGAAHPGNNGYHRVVNVERERSDIDQTMKDLSAGLNFTPQSNWAKGWAIFLTFSIAASVTLGAQGADREGISYPYAWGAGAINAAIFAGFIFYSNLKMTTKYFVKKPKVALNNILQNTSSCATLEKTLRGFTSVLFGWIPAIFSCASNAYNVWDSINNPIKYFLIFPAMLSPPVVNLLYFWALLSTIQRILIATQFCRSIYNYLSPSEDNFNEKYWYVQEKLYKVKQTLSALPADEARVVLDQFKANIAHNVDRNPTPMVETRGKAKPVSFNDDSASTDSLLTNDQAVTGYGAVDEATLNLQPLHYLLAQGYKPSSVTPSTSTPIKFASGIAGILAVLGVVYYWNNGLQGAYTLLSGLCNYIGNATSNGWQKTFYTAGILGGFSSVYMNFPQAILATYEMCESLLTSLATKGLSYHFWQMISALGTKFGWAMLTLTVLNLFTGFTPLQLTYKHINDNTPNPAGFPLMQFAPDTTRTLAIFGFCCQVILNQYGIKNMLNYFFRGGKSPQEQLTDQVERIEDYLPAFKPAKVVGLYEFFRGEDNKQLAITNASEAHNGLVPAMTAAM